MRKPFDAQRRKFLRCTLLAGIGAAGAGCSRNPSPWRTLTTQEGQTLMALCDQIIPPDEDPGASDCGVVTYIDRQLGAHYAQYRQLYRDALAALEESARLQGAPSFARLPLDRQQQLVAALERGDPPGQGWKKISASQFFTLVVAHTMQGYYGDPRHGGNRDMAAWKMIGVPSPPVRGRHQIDIREAQRT